MNEADELRKSIRERDALIGRMVKANRRLRDEIDHDRIVGGLNSMVRADAVMAWLDSIIDLDAIRELGIGLEAADEQG